MRANVGTTITTFCGCLLQIYSKTINVFPKLVGALKISPLLESIRFNTFLCSGCNEIRSSSSDIANELYIKESKE